VFRESEISSGEAFLALDRLLDEGRFGPVFLVQVEVAEVVAATVQGGVRAGHYLLHAWVVMPNHVHLAITPLVELSLALGSLKGLAARRANAVLGRTGMPFWQDESFDRLVRSGEEFARVVRYVERNPVKAGLVARAEEYRWSSAWRP